MIVHFNDAQPGQCRYALWTASTRTGLICGAATKAGSSYCPEHHALVYEPATPKRLAALDAVSGRIVSDAARRQPAPNIHPEFEEQR